MMTPGSNTQNGIRVVNTSCNRGVLNSSTPSLLDSQISTDQCCVLHDVTQKPHSKFNIAFLDDKLAVKYNSMVCWITETFA